MRSLKNPRCFAALLSVGIGFALRLSAQSADWQTVIWREPQVRYAPEKRFLVQINPDGSFTSRSGAARLQGKASGKGLSGDAFGEACTFHFDTSRP